MEKAQKQPLVKRILTIAGKTLWGIFIAVYVLLALANYSLVQSLAGSWVSSYLSKETGGELHVGAIGIGIFDHVRLYNVLLCDPKGDTIFDFERILVNFNGIPVGSEGLSLQHVSIRNGYYFLGIDENGINLKFLINYFKKDKKEKTEKNDFIVRVNRLNIINLRYKMRLKNYGKERNGYGINPKAMDYSDINIRMRNVRVLNDHITLRMDSMTAREKSGFRMNDFSGYVYVTPYGISVTDLDLYTEGSHIKGDVMLRYNGWHDMSDYINNVHMLADIKEGSVGCLKDASYWAPVLWPLDEKLEFSGLFYGPVADLHAENVSLAFGTRTNLKLNGYITGIPDMKNTIINGEVIDMVTCVEDWLRIRYPDRLGSVQLPKQLSFLSPVEIGDMVFVGTPEEFMASAEINTEAGGISADAILKKDSKSDNCQYIGSIKSNNFVIKNLFPNNFVSALGFDITLQGAGLSLDSMQLSAEALLNNVAMHGEKIDYVELNAEMNGRAIDADMRIEDPLAEISLSAALDFNRKANRYAATANLETLDLAQLGLVNTSDINMVLSGQVSLDISGNTLDELVGSVMLNNMDLRLPDRNIHMNKISLLSRRMDDYRNISLDCDMLHCVAKGKFDYSDFGIWAKDLCHRYVPVYHNPFKDEDYEKIQKAVEEKNLYCDLEIELIYNDPNNVLSTIVPGLYLSDSARIYCKYNPTVDELEASLRGVDTIAYGSIVADNLQISVSADKGHLTAVGIANALSYSSAISLKNMGFGIKSRSSDAKMLLWWDDKENAPTSGDLHIAMESTPQENRVRIESSSFSVKGEKWQVADKNEIIYGNKLLNIKNLLVESDQQSLLVNGYVSPDSTDELNVRFNKFDVGVFDLFLENIGLSIGGSLYGNLSLRDFYKTLYYDANMDIEDCQLNGRSMGNTKIISRWDADKNRIGVLLTSVMGDDTLVRYPINMKGFYYPQKDGKLDFEATFNGFDLTSVAPYLKSFSSQFEGGLHGNFAINGTLNQPRITGEAIFDNGLLKVDMFNTIYRFSDTVYLDDNQIFMKNFEFVDPQGNMAYINGTINHNYLRDFVVDLSLVSDNIMIMNTSAKDNDLFYGTVFANISGTVKGPVNNITVAANATTNQGSTFFISLSDKQQISEQNFIKFVTKELGKNSSMRRIENDNNSRYKLLINIAANPNLKFSMPMDFSQMNASVAAVGNGNLQLSIASGSPFSLSGDYIIQSGSFKIDLMDLISRELTLENGSSLSWSGSPTDANIDIKGVYSQRVNLASLYSASSSMEQTTKTVNVESIIALSGQLLNPTIKFDFRLPNADQSTEEEVFAIIDRTNEREMINQTMSLLAFSQFYSSTSSTIGSFNGISSGLDIMANQVSSVVSSMVEFVDVNINYKSGDELVTDQLDIDISKEWNRFYFETTFGIGGDARTLNQLDDGSASTIIGDVLLGYKISPNFHLIAFNRSNANDYTKQDMPYTQGVGIKYSKDFDTWKSLFTRRRKAKNTEPSAKRK